MLFVSYLTYPAHTFSWNIFQCDGGDELAFLNQLWELVDKSSSTLVMTIQKSR